MTTRTFQEFIKALNDNEVVYPLVGGYAVNAHGHPRYTDDIDFWYENTLENAKRILRAIESFGFTDHGTTPKSLLKKKTIQQMGRPPLQIHLMNEIDAETLRKIRKSEKRSPHPFTGVAPCSYAAATKLYLPILSRSRAVVPRVRDGGG